MALLNFLKKAQQPAPVELLYRPYSEESTNIIYNLLFCDDINLYKLNKKQPYQYPYNILFSETSTAEDLQTIIDDTNADTRYKVLAYNKQIAMHHQPNKKELLAVIVEIGLDFGLATLASFKNGTARYINQDGGIIIWETTTDEKANELTNDLFLKSAAIVHQIGAWDKPRRQPPMKDIARITFLVSDGLYFGEGEVNVLFSDALAKPALNAATALLQYLTSKQKTGSV